MMRLAEAHGFRLTAGAAAPRGPSASSGSVDERPARLSAGDLLVTRNLTVARGQVVVLQDVSLSFRAGAVTVVVGRSGVGKTTLLHTLNGLLRPVRGSVRVRGLGELGDEAALAEHRRRTATIYQEHALIHRLSALENVKLGLADRRHPLAFWPWPRALTRRAAQALADVGLLHRAHVPVSHLSGGERQRVGVARALTRDASLVLGDEPFSSVDPVLAAKLGDGLRRASRERGATVILVLHQLEMARALADRLVGLAEGGVTFDGPVSEFDEAASRRVFEATAGHWSTTKGAAR